MRMSYSCLSVSAIMADSCASPRCAVVYCHPLWEATLGGRVVRVLDSGQLHQSERSWVRFLDGPLKKKLPGLRTVTWSRVQRVDQEKHD